MRDGARSHDAFLSEFSDSPSLAAIAERVWGLLVERSPLPEGQFIPSLDDRLAEDYGVVCEDLEDLIEDVLEGKAWSKEKIGSETVSLGTARDLIRYVDAIMEPDDSSTALMPPGVSESAQQK